MTRFEYDDILQILDNAEKDEKARCARYVELNPDDRAQRERDKSCFISALNETRYELKRQFSNRLA